VFDGCGLDKKVTRKQRLKLNFLLTTQALAKFDPRQIYGIGLAQEIICSKPQVMRAERTFWEKATAAHVYCLQGRLRGERYSRHWYDLAAFAQSPLLDQAVKDRALATQVAEHKTMFFSEKDAAGKKIDYFTATSGGLRLIPEGASWTALADDYQAMLVDGLLTLNQPDFETLLKTCAAIQEKANQRA
jgi:hypothetical protein